MLGQGSEITLYIGALWKFVVIWVFTIFNLLVRKIFVRLFVLWRTATTARRREGSFAHF
jgi:hypothetical protein